MSRFVHFALRVLATDQSEQFRIRHLCLGTILELLLTCKMYPCIGGRGELANGGGGGGVQRFLHVPRTPTLQANTIG